MNFVEYACVFVRATGDRLLSAERLVTGLPHLFGPALVECDLAYRVTSKYLVLVLRFQPEGFHAAMKDRLSFWTARAGGRASSVAGMVEKDREAFRAHLDLCEIKALRVPSERLFEAAGALFTEAGSPAGRRRAAGDRPTLAMEIGGPGWEGTAYDPARRALFIAAPIVPPRGDEIPIVFRLPGADRPVGVRAHVGETRSSAEATPGKPAGFTLVLPDSQSAVARALAEHAPSGVSEVRVAPRYPVKSPVKVMVPAPPPTTAGSEGSAAHATIEYATDQELAADFIENLSQGGAFVRSAHPAPVGTPIALDFRLPNGAQLEADGVVMFVNANGMGVKFRLDEEADQELQAAIAHISARARRALVVDDDALVRRMLADALADRGFEVLTAADGADGLRVLSEELLGLDLLLTDVHMPGMDGEAFLKTIRDAGGESELAVVVVTGKMLEGLERRLEQAGADAVLDKALGPELVAQAADAVLERKRVGRT